MAEFGAKIENGQVSLNVNGDNGELMYMLCALANELCEITGMTPKMLGNVLPTGITLDQKHRGEVVKVDLTALEKRGQSHGNG